MSAATTAAVRFTITGVVQGVGFRPFVYRLATELGLVGLVGNDAATVFVEVAGSDDAVATFERRLRDDAPPLARIDRIERSAAPLEAGGATGFVIVESRPAAGRTFVPPDTATCDDCRRELFDPADRRYRHPFVTCTNCGPRFTIIVDLPYDRPTTTLAGFPMCALCAAEYANPADRRFHAQPIGCHDCGPRLWFRDPGGGLAGDPITAARSVLDGGGVVAVKGIGGYHLACDATSDAAVGLLRARKARPDKPFAVMVADLDAALAVADLDPQEAELLASAERPIILARARPDGGLSPFVAPGNPLIGVMLAYTPVHYLLFDLDRRPLVMTSGNRSGEPIVHRDIDIEPVLGPLVDAVLGHDRPIGVPCDDSVVRVVDGVETPIRRSRGYAPLPVAFPHASRDVLAVGGELKNAACVVSAGQAWLTQHLGDMENLATLEAFEASTAQLQRFYDVRPVAVAIDSHPRYLNGAWARRTHPGRVVEVQHHHAHVAAVMAEAGLHPDTVVVGVSYDGTGYGSDGTIWGGEVLVADAHGFERVGHLAPVPLPGGDAAVQNPCRVALAHLWAAGVDWAAELPPVAACDEVELRLLARQLETGFACVPTTSMGRLFDAVSSLVGLRHRISYEAQGAIELEIAAEAADGDAPETACHYRFDNAGGVLDPRPVLRAIVADLAAGVPVARIAAGFHRAVATATADVVAGVAAGRGLDTVVLSGGVFQNGLVVRLTRRALEAAGLAVLTHRIVPPNDGGLALGQAYVAAHRPHPTPPQEDR